MHHLKNKEKGSALVYILIAIALLTALTVSFLGSDTQQSRSQNAFRLATTIENQIHFIRSAIQECVLTYPRGDASVNSMSTTDAGYIAPYPLTPSSTHFTGSTLGAAANAQVSNLRCPGNPGGDQNNHEPIFGGSTGRFLPPAPALFNDWEYTNGTLTMPGGSDDGVILNLSSSNTDPFITEAFQRVDERFSSCEITLLTSSDAACSETNCLIYWINGQEPGCS